jgi:hypothetical protein
MQRRSFLTKRFALDDQLHCVFICQSNRPVHAKIPVMIPKGAEVEILDGPLNGNRLMDVRWDGKTVMVFTNDVRDRGERVDAPKVS